MRHNVIVYSNRLHYIEINTHCQVNLILQKFMWCSPDLRADCSTIQVAYVFMAVALNKQYFNSIPSPK
jgi:hypothetical protein